MPLDQAVYSSGDDKIYACRGPWIFKLNANTGAKEASLLVTSPSMNYGSIALSSVTDRIYLAVWGRQDTDPATFGSGKNDIYAAVLSTFSVVGSTGYMVAMGIDSSEVQNGPRRILIQGTNLFFWTGGPGSNMLGMINILVPATNWTSGLFYGGFTNSWMDLAWDSTGSVLLATDPSGPAIATRTVAGVPGGYYPAAGVVPFGLAFSAANNSIYFGRASTTLGKYAKGTATFSSIALGRPNAVPICVRCSPIDGKIYVPCGKDNTVCIVDPSSGDSVTVKTGFDCPMDVVFTATKAFAVQQGAVGLKEIT